MQTFYNYDGAFFYIDLVIDEYTVDGNYCLELSRILEDSSSISTFDTYSFSSEKERDDFKEQLSSKLRRIALLDEEIEDILCQ